MRDMSSQIIRPTGPETREEVRRTHVYQTNLPKPSIASDILIQSRLQLNLINKKSLTNYLWASRLQIAILQLVGIAQTLLAKLTYVLTRSLKIPVRSM